MKYSDIRVEIMLRLGGFTDEEISGALYDRIHIPCKVVEEKLLPIYERGERKEN